MKKLYLALLISIATYNLSIAQCTPNFEASQNPICISDSVYYTNLTVGTVLTYTWNFGSNATPATYVGENPPRVAYSTAGTKNISLTTTCFALGSNCIGASTLVIPGSTFTITTTCLPVFGGIITTTKRTTSVTVLATPIPAFTSTTSVCAGVAIDFTYSGTVGATSYSWNFGTGASPNTSNDKDPKGIFYSTSGTKNVSLTVSNGACSRTTTQIITINQTPTSSFFSTAPACSTQPVDFTNTGNGTSWSWNFGAGATPGTSSTKDQAGVTYSSPGAKTVTLTSAIGTCSVTATEVITIYPSPTATFTTTATACTKASINFTNTGSTGGNWRYSWDFGAGATPISSSTENPKGIIYSTPGLKTILLTVYNSNCITTTTQTITINATPTANFISNAPACTGIPVDFFNTGTTTGVTWAWDFGSGAAPTTSTTQNQAGVVYSTSGGKIIQLVTTNSVTTCADTIKHAITIYQSPNVLFDIDTAILCMGQKAIFTNKGSTGANWTYVWDFGAGAQPNSSTAENPVGIFYNFSGKKTIKLTVSDDHCSATLVKKDTITVNPTPTGGFSSSAPQCTNLPVDFISTGDGTASYWSFGVNANPATSNTKDQAGVIYSTPGVKIVTLVSSIGTCSITTNQGITIHQSPIATFTSNEPKCVGDSVRFKNTGSTGGMWTYFWDFGQDALPQTSTGENPSGVAFSTGGTKIITFTIFDGYCTKTATQSITINAQPIAKAGRDTTICANTTVQIGAVATGGTLPYTYSWFAPVTLSNGTIANPVATPVAHITQYIVTVTDKNKCVNKDTIIVTMLDPIKAYAGVDETICRYDSVQIGVGLVEQQIYKWKPAAGLTSTISPNPIASPDSTTTYTVTVTYSGKACKAETDEVKITVHQLPYIEAGTVRHQPRPNDSTTIVDTITIGASVELIAIGGLQYNWVPPYRLDNVGIYNPNATPDTTTAYIVTGTDIYGCKNTDSVIIKVIAPAFWVPTAFTPNGNGENDVFYVRGAGIKNFEMGIFNRWGEQIFITKSIDLGWDGKRPISGEELPAGAYVYYVKGILTDGTSVNSKGLINLIR